MIRTQYYKVLVEGTDVTKDVYSVSVVEEDGVFSSAQVSFRNGYLWLETLGKGNKIEIIGGKTRATATSLFTGYISAVNPSFKDNGEVELSVPCLTFGHVTAGIQKKSVLYPDEDNKDWSKSSPLWYSSVIESVAKDNGFKIGNIAVGKGNDKQATFKSPLDRKNKTVWDFLTYVAKEIKCVLWEEWVDGDKTLFCVDEEKLVNTISNKSFYFLARNGGKFSVDSIDDNSIQIIRCDINLDTRNGKAYNKISVKKDPKTGKDKISTESYDKETNKWVHWVFKEELLEKESEEVKNKVFDIVTSSNSNLDKWDVIKKYFVQDDDENKPSQEPLPQKFGVKITTGNFSNNKQYTTTDELNHIPPEEQAELLKQATAGKLSGENFNKYFKEVDKKEVKKDSGKPEKEAPVSGGSSKGGRSKKKAKTRRDDGFNIVATTYGDNNVKTKMSYLVQGIGKYSATYYLYKIVRNFGDSGYNMDLTFTK